MNSDLEQKNKEIQQEIDTWSLLYGKRITEEDYKEICENLAGFFLILKRWDEEEKTKRENSTKQKI